MGSEQFDDGSIEVFDDYVAEPGTDKEGPLQRLDSQGGAGVPLAAAAADVAQHGDRYTSRTQMATVIAYHVVANEGVEPGALRSEIMELHRRPRGSLFVDPGPQLGSWLDADPRREVPVNPTTETVAWISPIAVWMLDDVDRLVTEVAKLTSIFTRDASSIVVSAASAGAVAGASLLMTGRDLILAAAETADAAIKIIEGDDRFVRIVEASAIAKALDRHKTGLGSTSSEVREMFVHDGLPVESLPVLQGIVAAADGLVDPIARIEAGSELGPDMAVLTGAIVGGQNGLRRWPWKVANETWFAEIGRRLAQRNREFRDLPIPFAVEERMRSRDGIDPANL